jgi:hypothetical protein
MKLNKNIFVMFIIANILFSCTGKDKNKNLIELGMGKKTDINLIRFDGVYYKEYDFAHKYIYFLDDTNVFISNAMILHINEPDLKEILDNTDKENINEYKMYKNKFYSEVVFSYTDFVTYCVGEIVNNKIILSHSFSKPIIDNDNIEMIDEFDIIEYSFYEW